MKGLTSEEHAILLRAEKNEVRALQHGAEVSNMAPGLVQVSSRQNCWSGRSAERKALNWRECAWVSRQRVCAGSCSSSHVYGRVSR